MELTIEKKIGRNTYPFTVEGKNLYELVMESQKLSFGNVDKCGHCGEDNLILNARLAQKKFKYVEVKCLKCKSSLVFGSTTENQDVYYLRKEEADEKGFKKFAWKAYNPEEVNE
jgi:phage FluMu protein Com